MREFSVPAAVPVADDESLADMVWANAERFPAAVSFRRRKAGHWEEITTRDFRAEVTAVAKGLLAAGVRAGERVALLSKTRYEWAVLDFAIWAAGAVTVPIYETSSAEQVQWILSDSGSVTVIVETAAHRAVVNGLRGDLPALARIWQFEPPAGSGLDAIAELTALGATVSDEDLAARRSAVAAADLATLIYTSGTTGRPKGCELTHRNLLAEVRAAVAAFPRLMVAGNSVLLFLPLAHVLARVIQVAAVYARLCLGHTSDVKNLVADLGSFRPTFVLSVPRVFEKVYNTAKQKAHAEGKGRIFDAAATTAVAWSQATDSGKPDLLLRTRHVVFDKIVYTRLRAALGGNCVAAVSGGAALGPRLGHFFRGVGMPVLEGYGLTETTAAATVNTENATKIGTVGRPVAGVAVRTAEDGEILVRGDVVFRGYWHNGVATAEALTDGWFHTGDVGELDDEGFLRITGRKKEIIVTAGGKNVAPSVLEDRLRSHPLVSQCMVVGDNQPFIGALVTLDVEALPAWKAEYGKPADADVADLVDDADLRAEIETAVAEANKAVSHAEAIKKFRVLAVDFTEEGGELTPTLKLKRTVVSKQYAQEIEALYAG